MEIQRTKGALIVFIGNEEEECRISSIWEIKINSRAC